nr:hypothetical protein [Asgard group archaeon]
MNAAKIKSAPSLIFELYYTSAETPKEDLEEVISILEKLQKKQNINFKLFENPNDKNNQILADEIRTAATRGKFKVVSGGGAALALSGSKKINYPHGPILVVRKDDRIVRVYPYG